MSEPFLAEIRMVSFNFAPRGFAQCDGQILPINQNQSLYSLLGTTYGGDGRTTFALPDLRGRVPVHQGPSNTGGGTITLGQKGGEERHTLAANEMPAHGHARATQYQAGTGDPSALMPAAQARGGKRVYAAPGGAVVLDGQGVVGEGQLHENMQPFTTINFVIALQGLFPSRN